MEERDRRKTVTRARRENQEKAGEEILWTFSGCLYPGIQAVGIN